MPLGRGQSCCQHFHSACTTHVSVVPSSGAVVAECNSGVAAHSLLLPTGRPLLALNRLLARHRGVIHIRAPCELAALPSAVTTSRKTHRRAMRVTSAQWTSRPPSLKPLFPSLRAILPPMSRLSAVSTRARMGAVVPLVTFLATAEALESVTVAAKYPELTTRTLHSRSVWPGRLQFLHTRPRSAEAKNSSTTDGS